MRANDSDALQRARIRRALRWCLLFTVVWCACSDMTGTATPEVLHGLGHATVIDAGEYASPAFSREFGLRCLNERLRAENDLGIRYVVTGSGSEVTLHFHALAPRDTRLRADDSDTVWTITRYVGPFASSRGEHVVHVTETAHLTAPDGARMIVRASTIVEWSTAVGLRIVQHAHKCSVR